MKILIVSTLKRKVTPEVTASRSQIIYHIASGLVKKGHSVSLLGTADSNIPGVKNIPIIEKGWVDLPPAENPFLFEIATMVQLAKKIVEVQDSFDIIHNHLYPEFFTPLIEQELTKPMVTTVHVQATDYIDTTLGLFQKSKFVSISQAHRSAFHKASIYKVIYNGIDTTLFSLKQKEDVTGESSGYLLWLGRLSKAKNSDGSFMDPKGVKWAIQLAEETGNQLILSGNVEDMKFYKQGVEPHLSEKIRWFGPVSSEQLLTKEQVVELMQKARVFLMTVNWEEPFGLVMAEAMSCGTPVIGFNRGSVPELVVDGKTGFIVPPPSGTPESGVAAVEGLKDALSKINTIKSEDCRNHVLENFSLDTMVNEYEKLYKELI
ncbi:glycosyltransferase family 4 protein [Candidatus Roizmanbacteria bacterium]|nr:glycosyltransferase family 4 protein [Candidatus Roizmanbacteria bacterium]